MLVPEPGAIYVMDRGYIDFRRLYGLHRTGAFFVTCAKSNLNGHRVYSAETDRTGGVIADQTIALDGIRSRRDYPVHLRRIRFKDPATGKTLIFLTNQTALPASTVCDLYKSRWQVELFFKWIKQHLRIKRFYGTSENAVKTLALLSNIGPGATLNVHPMRLVFSVVHHNRQAVIQGVTVQACIEAVLGISQHAAEATSRHQCAGAGFGTETLDYRLVGLQLPHQGSNQHLSRRNGEHDSTPSTAHCSGDTEGCEILDNLVEMIAGQASKFTGEHLNIQMVPGRLTGKKDQDAKGDVGGREQAHRVTSLNWY